MTDFYISPLTDDHPTLYHYTNAQGLQGIIESQQLHATDINYLNDAEEHIHFCEKRLPELLDRMWEDCSEEERTTIIGLGYGGKKNFQHDMLSSFSKSVPNNSSFTVSFSIPPSIYPDDGLLSQWRAYGRDGGYAIEFSTADLVQQVQSELERFHYPYAVFAPTHYGLEMSQEREHLENRFLNDVKKTVLNYDSLIFSFPLLQGHLAALSILVKHPGFREEREFRMAFVRPDLAIHDSEKAARANPLCFRPGSLKPYIALFEKKMGLPIQRIIVGPHPEKEKRKAAVEALLRQNNIKAEVITSSIPYLGT